MNKLFLALAICLGLSACGSNGAKKDSATNVEQTQLQETKDRVEILYFHGKQRCATCMAIEKNAKEAIEAQFADELKKGRSYSRQSTSPSRRTRLLPTSTRLHGRLFSSANGKTERKRMKI